MSNSEVTIQWITVPKHSMFDEDLLFDFKLSSLKNSWKLLNATPLEAISDPGLVYREGGKNLSEVKVKRQVVEGKPGLLTFENKRLRKLKLVKRVLL